MNYKTMTINNYRKAKVGINNTNMMYRKSNTKTNNNYWEKATEEEFDNHQSELDMMDLGYDY